MGVYMSHAILRNVFSDDADAEFFRTKLKTAILFMNSCSLKRLPISRTPDGYPLGAVILIIVVILIILDIIIIIMIGAYIISGPSVFIFLGALWAAVESLD